jgi:hypothetical protein
MTMKFIEKALVPTRDGEGICILELTRRNLQTLLDKLDDAASGSALIDPDGKILVRAVENEEHYSERAPGAIFMPSTGEIR